MTATGSRFSWTCSIRCCNTMTAISRLPARVVGVLPHTIRAAASMSDHFALAVMLASLRALPFSFPLRDGPLDVLHDGEALDGVQGAEDTDALRHDSGGALDPSGVEVAVTRWSA